MSVEAAPDTQASLDGKRTVTATSKPARGIHTLPRLSLLHCLELGCTPSDSSTKYLEQDIEPFSDLVAVLTVPVNSK
jgi:hypothetical protein